MAGVVDSWSRPHFPTHSINLGRGWVLRRSLEDQRPPYWPPLVTTHPLYAEWLSLKRKGAIGVLLAPSDLDLGSFPAPAAVCFGGVTSVPGPVFASNCEDPRLSLASSMLFSSRAFTAPGSGKPPSDPPAGRKGGYCIALSSFPDHLLLAPYQPSPPGKLLVTPFRTIRLEVPASSPTCIHKLARLFPHLSRKTWSADM